MATILDTVQLETDTSARLELDTTVWWRVERSNLALLSLRHLLLTLLYGKVRTEGFLLLHGSV